MTDATPAFATEIANKALQCTFSLVVGRQVFPVVSIAAAQACRTRYNYQGLVFLAEAKGNVLKARTVIFEIWHVLRFCGINS